MNADDRRGVSLPQLSKDHDESRLEILTTKEKLSSAFTIACSECRPLTGSYQTRADFYVLTEHYVTPYNSHWSTQLSNSLTVGTILGQIIIGYLCDVKGRKWGIVLSTVMIVIGIILCTASHGANGSFIGFLWMFTVCRGITGIGLGGEYPSCSTSAAEAANEKIRKQRGPVFIMVTNFVLSFGTPFACILYLIVFEAAGGLQANLSTVWRTVFGISCIPPLAVFYFRFKMLNSQLYRKGAIQHNVPHLLTIKYYWKFLDRYCGGVVFVRLHYLPQRFSGQIISSVVLVKGKELVRKTAEYQLLLGTIALPGCVVGALLVNHLGRRNTMILGFSGYLIFGLAVGCAYDKVIKNVPGFIVLYGLMNSFANAGPGDMLGLTSSESYATAVRGTCYGFSAAIGKVGAVLGTQAFKPIQDNLGKRWTFIIAAICGLAGMTVTWFFIRNDLDGDLAIEDAKFQVFLEANGWHGDVGAAESVDALVVSEKGKAKVSTG
ncbi:major facilitator superfamily domain-containing protein [Desarmillaria tabescens]|uniref:Major facilitator superfamily domain-containing protein n=1 Tax=Armillaria tabescens TaxID=1929756 RepID=A0AA39NJR2_ARMTA|nr:major facilitator superfamily domain-containing protein [Desarmillaria tabescens]KAK0466921.1 major facilitator superfamily domain-containing protein [Desarmillaria tabescens]